MLDGLLPTENNLPKNAVCKELWAYVELNVVTRTTDVKNDCLRQICCQDAQM